MASSATGVVIMPKVRPESPPVNFTAKPPYAAVIGVTSPTTTTFDPATGFVPLPGNDELLFAGSLWVTELERLSELGLAASMLPPNDPLIDLLMTHRLMMTAQQSAQRALASMRESEMQKQLDALRRDRDWGPALEGGCGPRGMRRWGPRSAGRGGGSEGRGTRSQEGAQGLG